MSVLICGSVAFDTIMVFPGHFQEHILPEQIRILNVSFLVPEMRREFGGCAGNIAYNLKLLGGDPRVLATVGDDAGPYLERMNLLGIDSRYVLTLPGTFTAQCFVTTDLDANQLAAFHPGAMNRSHENKASAAMQGVTLGIVAPDGREGMVQHARDLHSAGVPFIFDPSQGLPILSEQDLLECLDMATYCIVNDYEANLICSKTGLTIEQLTDKLDALIVTFGAYGSKIFTRESQTDVPAVPVREVVDPVGCGDSYRSGLLYGISNGWTLEKSARLAAVMGAFKIEHQGAQNHAPSRAEIAERYRTAFGQTPWEQ